MKMDTAITAHWTDKEKSNNNFAQSGPGRTIDAAIADLHLIWPQAPKYQRLAPVVNSPGSPGARHKRNDSMTESTSQTEYPTTDFDSVGAG
jgi:hypothetical protein